MKYSLSDLYPEFDTPTTTDATIPDQEENAYYNEQVTPDNKLVIDKTYLFGTIVLIIALMFVFHFLR